MELTTAQAAERLGISANRVRALISSGNLEARRVGTQWLVAGESVERQARLVDGGATGRPMATRIAWAAADLVDGGAALWLAPSERVRLRNRVAHSATPEVVQRWMARRSGPAARFRAGPQDLREVLAADRVVRTGISAAEAYQLGLGTGDAGDAYVAADRLPGLVEKYFLVESPKGNLTIRSSSDDLYWRTARQVGTFLVAPRMVVGADLADDPDPRTRALGLELLRSLPSTMRESR